MSVVRVVPNLSVPDVETLAAAVAEHVSVLGLRVVMDHGWVVALADDSGRHQLNLITQDAGAPMNPDVSVFLDSLDAVREALAAVESGAAGAASVVHPLTEEAWGVTRFFYRDTAGRVINVGTHT